MVKYAIACGGSGGHLNPGIAIAESLCEDDCKCYFIISQKSIDSVILSRYPHFSSLRIPALPMKTGIMNFARFAISQIKSFFKCIKFLKKEKIDCVVGMGGFTSLAAVMAAFFLRKKVALHECNAIPGRATKFLAPFADLIFLPEGVSLGKHFFKRKTIHAGLPLRNDICKIDKKIARGALGLNHNLPVVTVLGGSQGATSLNQWARENLQTLNADGIAVCCVQGPKFSPEEIVGTHKRTKVKNLFMSYCHDMSPLLSATDLLVCQAGAGTIAEASYFGLYMILVPYPNSALHHQDANALHARNIGIAQVVDSKNIDKLTDVVLEALHKNKLSCTYDGVEQARETKQTIVSALKKLLKV